ncbi:DNA replication/repair protein RecF [Alkalicoccobacillus plakortidis]|uniref:DNA replication and repair protein RecF n=1 Tax=Alkalicoccobacillus plakortidis TaxID=444060 RepID=A0ABT0XKM4_9BACI|nr:DNA replication/repair protein RecF [Alkalicoccobacillus plakortidis]MCM2676458.1 DNA replication/repair protein RecF [Alkalicoccobacillus plakortidis]
MRVNKLSLKHYRNYAEAELEFNKQVHVFVGDNAQGKTNVLEAIYVLAMAKSHRTAKDKELISWGQDYAGICGEAQTRRNKLTLDLTISSKGKKVKLNGLEQRRLSEYVGALNVVMFAPEDLHLVKGSPQGRRRFMDMELGQISPIYLHHSSRYQKILQQRNSLLRDWHKNQLPICLEILTEQLIDTGAELIKRRAVFLQKLQKWAETIHFDISRGTEELKLIYLSTVEVSEDLNLSTLKERLHAVYKQKKDKEQIRGTTLFGPHREDIGFLVNEKDVQSYGSQGQQRTTALALKLAEIELIKEEVGEYPVLLLDDVLSELDDYRQSHLLETIQRKVQTFVTTTGLAGVHQKALENAEVFEVKLGHIQLRPTTS